MKNAIKVICFVLAVLIIGTASGFIYFTWDVGEFETVEGSKAGTAIITEYIGEATEVVIPEKLRGKKIISIEEYNQMMAEFKEKYTPKISSLFFEIAQ